MLLLHQVRILLLELGQPAAQVVNLGAAHHRGLVRGLDAQLREGGLVTLLVLGGALVKVGRRRREEEEEDEDEEEEEEEEEEEDGEKEGTIMII